MARIKTGNQKLDVKKDSQQSSGSATQQSNNTPQLISTTPIEKNGAIDNIAAFGEAVENTGLGKSFNRVGDALGAIAGHATVVPYLGAKGAVEAAKEDSKYLNQNKIEQTAGGGNYGLDSTIGVNEQGQRNALMGGGSMAGIPVQNVQGVEQSNQGERFDKVERNFTPKTLTPNGEATQQQGGTASLSGANIPSGQTQGTTTQNTSGVSSSEGEVEKPSAEYMESVSQNMANDLQQVDDAQIFGKTTADEGIFYDGIDALQDKNSVYQIDAKARIGKVQNILSMGVRGFALSMAYGNNAFNETTINDVQRYAPDFWEQVQAEIKKIKSGDTVNAIASGTTLPNTTNTGIENINKGVDSWAESNSTTPQQTTYNIQNISNSMANNGTATSAVQLVDNLNAQIEDYKKKISNLEREANSIFKGDVPDYIVKAYMNNRRLQYQDEIDKLEGRRDSALDMYKFELNYGLDREGMNLKWAEYQRSLNNDAWEREYKMKQLNMDNIKIIDGKAYQINGDGTMTQLTDATAYAAYQQDVNSLIQSYTARYTAGGGTKTATGYKYNVHGGQCEEFTDNFTEATTGLRMEGANGRSWTYATEKMSYINSMIPEVGSIAVAVGGAYDSLYGHTMLVTGYDPNTGIVNLLWSNKDGDETVYSTTASLSDLYNKGLQGFWNPYYDLIKQGVSNGQYGYTDSGVLITPMTAVFDSLIENSSSGADREAVANAERAYSVLYEIINDGSLATLINSGDFGKMWNVISKADFANTGDDEGFTFKNMLTTYLQKQAAKEFSGGTESMNALRKLIELVETKLRKESGAVINSGEWKSNFELFLPMPGDTEEYMWDKMGDWDSIITKFLRSGGMLKSTDYIPLFPKGGKREIW